MVYEYCEGGDLQSKIPLLQKDILSIAKKIINACLFASKFFIIHRDLKPANILFKNQKVKVADWGFSRFLKSQHNAQSFIGSPAYMAPQILKGQQYSSKADVWSFGIMIYECITGNFPWNGSNIKNLLNQIQRKPLKLSENIDSTLKKILKQSLVINPQKRSSFFSLNSLFQIKQIKEKYKQYLNPQQGYLQKIQQQELTIDEVKKCSFYLQIAKKMTLFENKEAKNICLGIIIDNLQQLKNKNQSFFINKTQTNKKYSKINFTSTTMTQKKLQSEQKSQQLIKAKSYGKIKKQINSKSLSKIVKQKKPQTIILLQQQIQIIKKMKQYKTNLYQIQGKKIKSLISTILNSIQPLKNNSVNRQSKSKQKKNQHK